MTAFQELEAIRRVKYRYLRALDTKAWDELASCFVPEATAAYDSGRYRCANRDEIVAFLRSALGSSSRISMHQVHHPEIDLLDAGRAHAVWYLEDVVIDRDTAVVIRGTALYEDDFVKRDGEWKIRHTGYRRVFEEVLERKAIPGWRITRTLFDGEATAEAKPSGKGSG